MLFRFNQAYNATRFYEDHARPVRYELARPAHARGPSPAQLVTPVRA
jgi:hypothetical protein